MLLFVAGAVFGEVQVSLFVAGAVFGEIWNDSRSAKCCIFQYKMLVVGVKSNLGHEAGCGLTVSWSDHSRIMLGSCSDRPRIVNDVSAVCAPPLSCMVAKLLGQDLSVGPGARLINFRLKADVVQQISLRFWGRSFFVAGAVFGEFRL